MVFYIAKQVFVLQKFAFEFVENILIRLAKCVGQYVEPSAMRHTDNKFAYPGFGSFVHDCINGRYQRFAAFERKPFLAYVFFMQEFLEKHGTAQFLEDMQFLFAGKNRGVPGVFHPGHQPFVDFGATDVGIFHANTLAIGYFEVFDNFIERGIANANFATGFKNLFAVLVDKTEIIDVKRWRIGTPGTHRVSFSEKVAAFPVFVNQVDNFKFAGFHIILWH